MPLSFRVPAAAGKDRNPAQFRPARLLLSFTLTLLLCPAAHLLGQTNATAPAPERLVRQVRPSLVALLSVDKRGAARSLGTGFFLSGDGLLATARHVAQAQLGLVAVAADGAKHPVTTWLGDDPDFDLSLLRIDGYASASHLKLAPGALPQTNQWLALVSTAERLAPSCSTGLVTEVISFPGLLAAIRTSVPVRAGQSGSPLLNAAGEVVGIVPYMSFEDTVTASPASALRTLLERARTNAPLPFAKRPRSRNRQALMVDPDFRLGIDALRRQDLREAELRLKRASKNLPDSPFVFTMLAVIQTQRAEFKAASATIEKALLLNPGSALPHLLKGVCLVEAQQVPAGLAAVRKSVELGLPDSDTLTSALVLLATGEAALGHPDRAREALEHLRRLDPGKAVALEKQLRLEPDSIHSKSTQGTTCSGFVSQ